VSRRENSAPDVLSRPPASRSSMKLLTVDEVINLWHCHRVTVLRLMTRGTLHWVEVDGEPLFDEVHVMGLKHPRIGKFPHLTISRGGSHEPRPVRLPLDQLLWRYQRIDEKFEKLNQEARWLAVEAQLRVARSKQARGDFERARDASRVGLDCGQIDHSRWNFPLGESNPAGTETLPPSC